MERAGEIRNLQEQVAFELIPVQREPSTVSKTGKEIKGKCIERACVYIADFVYEEKKNGEWVTVVEDTKGMRTKDYIIKRKLMLQKFNIRVFET